MGAAGRGVEGGRAVSVVSRNPRSETDARLVARFGAKRTVSRTVAHGPGPLRSPTKQLGSPIGGPQQPSTGIRSERKPRDE